MKARQPACAVALLMLLQIGCGGDGPAKDGETPPAQQKPEAAVVAYSLPFECVNELIQPLTPLHSGLTNFATYAPLAEEMAEYQDGEITFRPRLAERWEASDDRLSMTFSLRPDLTWSDGEPLTAEDVRFTWEAQTSAEVGWAYKDFKRRIRDVEVVDPQTVRFHYTEVYPLQLYDAVQGVILSKHAWSERPFAQWRSEGCEWFNERAVSSGPFMLQDLQAGQRATFVRNPEYFEADLPHLDRVVVEVVPERANQIAALRSGDTHFVEFVDYSDAAVLEEDPAVTLGTYVPRNYYFVAWNNTRPPFDSPAVRRALTLAIDRQAIIDSFFYGYGRVSHSPIASDVWAYNDELEPWPYDPGRAKEILAAEGFTDSDGDGILDRNGEPFRFELMTNAENSLRKQIMVMIQSQLQRIGIEVETRTLDFRSLIPPVNEQKFDAVVAGLSLSTDLDLSYNFHTKGIGPDGLNWPAFSDPETDRMIDELAASEDYAERKKLYDEVQARLHELQPVTFLYEGMRLYAVRAPLENVEPNTVSSFANMRHWRMADSP